MYSSLASFFGINFFFYSQHIFTLFIFQRIYEYVFALMSSFKIWYKFTQGPAPDPKSKV